MEEVRNPYAAPQALPEPPVDARERILASRGIRPGASLRDGILYSACFVPGDLQLQVIDAASPAHHGPLGTGVTFSEEQRCVHDDFADTLVVVA